MSVLHFGLLVQRLKPTFPFMFSNLERSDVMNLARPVLQMLDVKHTGHCATAQHNGALGSTSLQLYRLVPVLGVPCEGGVPKPAFCWVA